MSQTKCGCACHQDEYPRYSFVDGIAVCTWCKDEPCETVLMGQRGEAENAKT